jgi:hypothetical protein
LVRREMGEGEFLGIREGLFFGKDRKRIEDNYIKLQF